MDTLFNFKIWILVLLLGSNVGVFAKQSKIYNPIWVDSILSHKKDSVQFAKLLSKVEITTEKTTINLPQPIRNSSVQYTYLAIVAVIFFLLGILFFFFDDFIQTIIQSLYNTKKYNIYYTAHRLDNIFLNLVFLIIKMSIIAYSTLMLLQHMQNHKLEFSINNTIHIFALVFIFLSVKYLIENIIVWLAAQQKLYRFLNIYKLYYDLYLGLIFIFVSIVILYNRANILYTYFLIFSALYVIILLYKIIQLQQFVKIHHKIYFILYICTFKILPLLLLTKYLWYNYKINIYG